MTWTCHKEKVRKESKEFIVYMAPLFSHSLTNNNKDELYLPCFSHIIEIISLLGLPLKTFITHDWDHLYTEVGPKIRNKFERK